MRSEEAGLERITVERAAAAIAAGLGRPSSTPAIPTTWHGPKRASSNGSAPPPEAWRTRSSPASTTARADGDLALAEQLLPGLELEQLRLPRGEAELLLVEAWNSRVRRSDPDHLVERLALDRHRLHGPLLEARPSIAPLGDRHTRHASTSPAFVNPQTTCI